MPNTIELLDVELCGQCGEPAVARIHFNDPEDGEALSNVCKRHLREDLHEVFEVI